MPKNGRWNRRKTGRIHGLIYSRNFSLHFFGGGASPPTGGVPPPPEGGIGGVPLPPLGGEGGGGLIVLELTAGGAGGGFAPLPKLPPESPGGAGGMLMLIRFFLSVLVVIMTYAVGAFLCCFVPMLPYHAMKYGSVASHARLELHPIAKVLVMSKTTMVTDGNCFWNES